MKPRFFAWLLAVLMCALRVSAQNPALVATTTGGTVSLPVDGSIVLDLGQLYAFPGYNGTILQMVTTEGTFDIEMYNQLAPITVTNFLQYFEEGAYSNGIFHRLVPGFVVQGGGYVLTNSGNIDPVETAPPIPNEFAGEVAAFPTVNGASDVNSAGTLAMAKLGGDPNSATSQWFVNLVDNSHALSISNGNLVDNGLDAQNGGFTVFAHVIGNGMSVINALAALPTDDLSSNLGQDFTSTPLAGDTSNGISVSNLVVFNTRTVPFYAVGASKSNLVNLQLQGSLLGIQALPGATGTLTVTIAAGDGFGNSVPTTLKIVLGVPQITQEPKASLTVKQKGTVTLKIKATGPKSATLSYEWLRNGKAVKDNGLIAGLHKASMSISNVQKNQAGTYTVLVADAFGLVSSTACVVKVK